MAKKRDKFVGSNKLIKQGARDVALGTGLTIVGATATERFLRAPLPRSRGGLVKHAIRGGVASGAVFGGLIKASFGGAQIGGGVARKASGVKDKEIITSAGKGLAVLGGAFVGALLLPRFALRGSIKGLKKAGSVSKSARASRAKRSADINRERVDPTRVRNVKGNVIDKKGKKIKFVRVRGRVIPIRVQIGGK